VTDWLCATFRPVALFSLRSSAATSSGGKTNFVPTPYAVKMALLDVAVREGGVSQAEAHFEMLRDRQVRIQPPVRLVVNNTFQKIRREPKEVTTLEPFIASIGYREFCYYDGDLTVALDMPEDLAASEVLGRLLWHINYLGKRGGFVQCTNVDLRSSLGPGFSHPVGATPTVVAAALVVQLLDDMGPQAAWERVNTFSSKKVRVGQDRIFVPTALPYRLVASSRGYSFYERSG